MLGMLGQVVGIGSWKGLKAPFQKTHESMTYLQYKVLYPE